MTTILKYVQLLTVFFGSITLAMQKPGSITITEINNNSGEDAFLLYYYPQVKNIGGQTEHYGFMFKEEDIFPVEKAFYIRRGAKVEKPFLLKNMSVTEINPVHHPELGIISRPELVIMTKKGRTSLLVQNYEKITIKPDGSIDPK